LRKQEIEDSAELIQQKLRDSETTLRLR